MPDAQIPEHKGTPEDVALLIFAHAGLVSLLARTMVEKLGLKSDDARAFISTHADEVRMIGQFLSLPESAQKLTNGLDELAAAHFPRR